MRWGVRDLVLLLIGLVAPAGLGAQAVIPDPGEEVRVVQRGQRGAVQGFFVEASTFEVVLKSEQDNATIRLARAGITGMSVQRGYRSHTRKGALIGLGVGVLGGILLGQTSDSFESTGAAVGASVGAALPIGMLIGWFVRSPEWEGIDMAAITPGPNPYVSPGS